MSIFFNTPSYSSLRLLSSFGSFKFAALFLTIVLVIVLYCTILKDKNEKEGLLEKIANFLTFKTFCIGKLIEIVFNVAFIYNIIYGCLQLFVNPLLGLMYIIVFNIALRFLAEFIMLFVKIKENTDRKCNCCDGKCDCGCDCDDECGCGCGCNCDDNFDDEIIDIDLDEDGDNATIIVEDITDEVLDKMNEENKDTKEENLEKKNSKKGENK